MAAIPQPERTTVRELYKALAAQAAAETRRGHLGASQIGDECSRKLWLSWHWCSDGALDGRVFRLFRRGRLEEEQIIADLRAAGVTVYDRDDRGQQWTFSEPTLGGHLGGSMDGAACGLVEAPKTWHVLEIKTSNAKRFAVLTKKGVQEAEPTHWAQMQLYMHWSGMDRAYYIAVCKDDDQIYAERVRKDEVAIANLLARAGSIVRAPEPPIGISDKLEFFKCRMCSLTNACHFRRLPPVSCRTCAHATPELDGDARWSCAWRNADLTLEQQQVACDDHVYIPALVPAEQIDADPDANAVTYQLPSGRMIRNGSRDPLDASTYTSRELYAAQMSGGFDLLADPIVVAVREAFDAVVEVVEVVA